MSMTAPLTRRRLWMRLRFPVGLLLTIGVGLLGCAWLLARNLQAAINDLDRREPGWNTILNEPRTVPVDQNAALRVIDGARKIKRTTLAWGSAAEGLGLAAFGREAEQNLDRIGAAHLLSPMQFQETRSALNLGADALRDVRSIDRLPDGRFPIGWSDDGYQRIVENVEAARMITLLLRYDSLVQAQEGNLSGALHACRLALLAGQAIGDEPSLAQRERIWCRRNAMQILLRTLAQGEAADTDLAAVQSMLVAEEKQPLLVWALRGERANLHRQALAIESGAKTWFAGARKPPAAGALNSVMRVALQLPHAELLEYMTELIDMAEVPISQQGAAFAEIQWRFKEKPWSEWMTRHWQMERTIGFFQRSQTYLRCCEAMIAVERFRRQNQRWPQALTELVPRFLTELPRDPFDDQPLRFLRTNDGVIIYSIGPDQKDNGGTLTDNPASNGVDVGTQLWDVAQRRKPPAPDLPRFSGPTGAASGQ